MFRKLKEVLGIVRPRQCLVLSLYLTHPETTDTKRLLEVLLKWTRGRGVADPTWMEIDVKGMKGRNLKFDTAQKRIAELPNGTEINELWLNCALPGIDDRFVGWSWAASISPKTLDKSINIFFDTALEGIDFAAANELAIALMQVAEVHYGFATAIPFYYGPYFWASGSLYESEEGTLSNREQERLSKWAHARVEAGKQGIPLGMNYLRDVYEVNFLTATHLSLPVKNCTLAQWIEASQAHGKIQQLGNGLFCWSLLEKELDEARSTMGRALHLVCYGNYAVKSGGPYGHMYPY